MKDLGGGQEHSVFFFPGKTGRVLKVTKPPYFGCPLTLEAYAKNALWANLLFEDSIQFEGFLQVPEGVSVVVSQPFVIGRSPTLEQIHQWFRDQGFVPDGYNKWRGLDGVVIADAHTGNFIRRKDGFLVPIDLQIINPGALKWQ